MFQVCNIVLAVDESDVKGVDLVLGEAKIETSKELTEYYITDDPKYPKFSQTDKKEDSFNMSLM